MITRRTALKQTFLTTATLAAATRFSRLGAAEPAPAAAAAPTGPHHLPKLPYAFDALEPHIDAQTMEIHHGKHHAAYVNNLNKAIAGKAELEKKSLEELLKDLEAVPTDIRTAVKNNAGGHYNHALFWHMMSKNGGGQPSGPLKGEIDKTFGGFDKFKEAFSKAALGQFGSGWAWLVWNGKKLEIKGLANQEAPISSGLHPILGLDVWEHAYYLKYQNRRADYINAFFNVIAWSFVEDRFRRAEG